MNSNLLAIVRFYFAQNVFMRNVHYKSYERLDKIINRNRLITFLIASATLVVIVLQVVGLEMQHINLLRILSFCGMILTGASLVLQMFSNTDISEIKYQHKNIAENYKSLRDQYMSLIEEIISESSSESKLRTKHKELQSIYCQIGGLSPATTSKDYANAQSGLGIGNNSDEEFTWPDSEIDRFLPMNLRFCK